ncbi:hypothetical protein [Dyella humicola]|uniref:hypothetical protein n=1 Tax=Dyella humicola TaxID=2992126 RepID=UPI002259BA6A|nr:hypothetical protein [Dyella humicola]
MARFAPDIEKARRIAQAVNKAGSDGDVSESAHNVLAEEQPDLQTLAAAIGMLVPTSTNAAWHAQMRLALTAPLDVAIVEANMASQDALSTAADKLAKRNLYVSLASMFVALVSLIVAIASSVTHITLAP